MKPPPDPAAGLKKNTIQAPGQDAPDLHAIISHIPGMAFQVFRDPGGKVSMPYISEKSLSLLGIDAHELAANPGLFLDLVLPDDKPAYLVALAYAGGTHLSFNWEGRIRIKGWNDIKWISCRVNQREVAGGTMWDGIMLNITHSKLTEAEIERSREALSALTSHANTVKEQERMRISREIHDELGGYLTAIKMGLSWLSGSLPADAVKQFERAQYLDTVTDRAIEAIHRIAADLRPPLVEFGIAAALEWQLKQFRADFDIPCEFSCTEEQISLDPDASIAVFRIAQEALTNIARHAQATRVTVRIGKQDDVLRLEIADNGIGLSSAGGTRGRRSFGLLGMTERATALGGELHLISIKGKGTTVLLTLPTAAARGENAPAPPQGAADAPPIRFGRFAVQE